MSSRDSDDITRYRHSFGPDGTGVVVTVQDVESGEYLSVHTTREPDGFAGGRRSR
jgi:hypothetical protein